MGSLDIAKMSLIKIYTNTNCAIKAISTNKTLEFIKIIKQSNIYNKNYYINKIVNTKALPSDFFIELEKLKVSADKELYIYRILSILGIFNSDKIYNNGFYRRLGKNIKPKIIKYNRFGVRDDITSSVVYRREGSVSLNYILPTNNLFSDFLNKELYPSIQNRNKGYNVKINLAHQMLESYFGDLRVVEETLHTVALVGNLKVPYRFSYNCRNTYPGVCFIDIERTTHIDILESIIHESIHQILWPQISISSDGWIPTNKYHEVSAITNRTVDVSVLIQAAFIYSIYYCIRKEISDKDKCINIKAKNSKMINTLMKYTKNYPKSEEILIMARLMLEDNSWG